jgi:C-terminal processing protease CtpA/Prc
MVGIVNEHFYAPSGLDRFNEAAGTAAAQMPDLGKADPAVVGDVIDWTLSNLGASHTGRYTKDQVAYYELADVFRFAIRRDIRRVFPPDGEVNYAGIGITAAKLDGKTFITDVYDGGAAAEAGLLAGDEVLSVDDKQFSEIGSFAGKTGDVVTMRVRRTSGGEPIPVNMQVQKVQPGDAFLKAIAASARRLDQGGRHIGYIRLWSYTRDEVTRILYRELGQGSLKDVDGLVLDLRSKWGGAPGDAAETFVGRAADMEMIDRKGDHDMVTFRWQKPVVAIIDGGTRSGMEVLAYSLKKNGIPLVGAPTAGNVLAGTAYMLPDDSLLELAVADVTVGGTRLENNPVQPDIAVPFDVRYANGSDPQLDAATQELVRRLGGAPAGMN